MEAAYINSYFATLRQLSEETEATDGSGHGISKAETFGWTIDAMRKVQAAGNKVMFIGNGGSAGIASHLAIDYAKNGGFRALAFNDGAALTCLGNDYGYEHVFAKQVEWHARPGDLLVAISSSGRSANILNAVAAARRLDCHVLTLSGFGKDNPLRATGDRNLYVPDDQYGFVEVTHLALCHAILDMAIGWRPAA